MKQIPVAKPKSLLVAINEFSHSQLKPVANIPPPPPLKPTLQSRLSDAIIIRRQYIEDQDDGTNKEEDLEEAKEWLDN